VNDERESEPSTEGRASEPCGSAAAMALPGVEATALAEGEYRTLPERFWPVFDPDHRVDCWCLRAWRDPGFCWKRVKDKQ